MVRAVEGDLRAQRGARLGGAQLDAEALPQLAPQRLDRRLQLDERAERIEEKSARARAHATNPQCAKYAANSPSSTALTPTARSVPPRSPHQRASHIWNGNSTTM